MVELGAIASLKVVNHDALSDPVIHKVPHALMIYRMNVARVLGRMPEDVR